MKDFADLANSSGAFPDVIGVNCSGPAETDGTELTTDLFNDFMGAFQAILNDQEMTPSGTAESGSGTSQILNAIKRLIGGKSISTVSGMPVMDTGGLPSWYYNAVDGAAFWKSRVNSSYIGFPINPPRGISLTATVTCTIKPGDVRTGTNRMTLFFNEHYATTASNNSSVSTSTYDNGTANRQDVVSNYTRTFATDREYIFVIKSGNNGSGGYADEIYDLVITYS